MLTTRGWLNTKRTPGQKSFLTIPRDIIMVFFKVCLVVLGMVSGSMSQGSYYSSFSGPVSGAVDEIVVPEAAGFQTNLNEPSFDYVARPDYTFGYGVNDPVTGNAQKHEETRDGDTVRGQYSVLEPDGTVRTVVYTADPENGFQATVHRKPPSDLPQQFALDNPLGAEEFAPSADFTPAQEYNPADYTPSDYQPDYQPDYNPEY